jgi:histidinol dehydrogenase
MKTIRVQSDSDFQEALDRIFGLASGTDLEAIIAEKTEAARAIVEAVRDRGDEAVAEFTARFDGVTLEPEQFEVSEDEIEAAFGSVDTGLIAVLRKAYENISGFHGKFLRQSWEETAEDGTVLGQRITPIDSAGVYVPGGTAFYPSSVLMNIAPAKVAGVPEIIMVSPLRTTAPSIPSSWPRRASRGPRACSASAARKPWQPWPTGPRAFPAS